MHRELSTVMLFLAAEDMVVCWMCVELSFNPPNHIPPGSTRKYYYLR
jgi:hypothetical protein